jgi:hypothetical protein
LVLFAVFAVCVLYVLLTGAGVYERLTKRGRSAFDERTVPQYIATKVRQADCAGAIRVVRTDGTDVLCLMEEIDGERYVTRVYCYDGYVRELFTAESVAFDPVVGEKIAPAAEVSFSLEEESLYVTVTQADGTVLRQILTLRSIGREAGDEE